MKEMFRAAAPEAVRLLIDTMNDPTTKIDTRLKCAETILERALGKATQPIDLEGSSKLEIVLAPDLKELAK